MNYGLLFLKVTVFSLDHEIPLSNENGPKHGPSDPFLDKGSPLLDLILRLEHSFSVLRSVCRYKFTISSYY